MNPYKVIKNVVLNSQHQLTGRTSHFKNGDRVINIALLKIVNFADDPGYYLLYFDKNGNELTDTYHETIESAVEQADWEFNVKNIEWNLGDIEK